MRAKLEAEWNADKEYDHDGLMEEEDPRQAMHERFQQYATMGSRRNWWTMRWTEMSVVGVVYLAQLTQSDVGEMKPLTRKLRKKSEKWWQAAWNELGELRRWGSLV